MRPLTNPQTLTRLARHASTMTTPAKHEWLVILPDRPGALARRMAVRSEHLEKVMPGADAGFWRVGGALLDEPIREGEGPKINGSVMLAYAASKEEVIEKLKQDVYSRNDVWDWDKVQVHPFKSAFIKGT